jgi:predicted RNA binding protein YcfA (HicA-like mRNA interferase family)
MSKIEKLLNQILSGRSDQNTTFSELCHILKRLGFDERIRGSHHIFTRADVEEILNLQPIGSKAKPYQVKQVRSVIMKYKLTVSNE